MSDLLRDLPKICLHEHLDGSLRASTVAELAAAEGLALPVAPEALADWFYETADSGSLVAYLTTFDLTVAVLQRPEHLERVARELVEDLAADGVVYAEVRWAPEVHLREGSSGYEVVAAVWRGLSAGMATEATRGHAIIVRQILTAMRHQEPSTWTADLAVACRDLGVVGFDLAGPEAGFSAERFAEACRVVREAGLGLTVHAGEADGPASVQAALAVGATRLGHGVRIVEDLGSVPGEVAGEVLQRGVTLEVCPTSNLMTGIATTLADHPIEVLRRAGFLISISCDNRLMSCTTATAELAALEEDCGWTVDDCLAAQYVGIDAAFCDAVERDRVRRVLDRYREKASGTESS